MEVGREPRGHAVVRGPLAPEQVRALVREAGFEPR